MPEPTSSSTSSQSANASYSPDPTLDDAGLICRADVTSSPPPPPPVSEPPPKPPAVTKLMSAAAPPASVLPPSSTPPSTAYNNAGRTSEQNQVTTGYFDYGVTGTGYSAYVGAAAVKGRDPKTGAEAEVFSASVQVGTQNELQLGMARVGVSGKNGSIGAEAFTLRANAGFQNDDGSVGVNAGVGATIVGAEGTLTNGADSVTAGVSLGPSIGGSVGIRDNDKDGISEWCIKVSAGFVTGGVCYEGS